MTYPILCQITPPWPSFTLSLSRVSKFLFVLYWVALRQDLCKPGLLKSHYIVQDGLTLMVILLPQPPKCGISTVRYYVLLLGFHVCACVCRFSFVCLFIQACSGKRKTLAFIPQVSSTLFLDTRPLIGLERTKKAKLVGLRAHGIYLLIQP